jgi:L-histidine Nalpha-methyltransferase
MANQLGVEVRVHLLAEERHAALLSDVRLGMASRPRSIPPTWFYDEVGSRLFDEITRLEEYYLTRKETEILAAHAKEMATLSHADTLVEIGAGSSMKTKHLLDAMQAAGQLNGVLLFDVSEAVLIEAARDIHDTYDVPVTAVVGDFHRHLSFLPRGGNRLITMLGNTIGNLHPDQRKRFLFDLEASMEYNDWLLLGTDLQKEVPRLITAYDDASGTTARFNRNVLVVVNRELGANFDVEAFEHVALWNESECRIEMRLRSKRSQEVHIEALRVSVAFSEGEELLTEISSKFSVDGLADELGASGLVLEASWTDVAGDFLVSLSRPKC